MFSFDRLQRSIRSSWGCLCTYQPGFVRLDAYFYSLNSSAVRSYTGNELICMYHLCNINRKLNPVRTWSGKLPHKYLLQWQMRSKDFRAAYYTRVTRSWLILKVKTSFVKRAPGKLPHKYCCSEMKDISGPRIIKSYPISLIWKRYVEFWEEVKIICERYHCIMQVWKISDNKYSLKSIAL